MQLVCPAGNLPSLKAAIDEGADVVYLGFKDDTNARNFAGLNFNDRTLEQGLDYVRSRGREVYVALNTYPRPQGWKRWQAAVDRAADMQANALIAADMGVLDYAANRYPDLPLHLSVQGSATNYEALQFYKDRFGIRRAVLPRVLSMSQVKHVAENTDVEIEVFGFGSLCVMVEGRCLLSSYAAGQSPNTHGCCSPAGEVRYEETPTGMETRLGGVLVDKVGKGENAGYPTVCKGRYDALDKTYYAMEEPTSLNTLDLLPELLAAGISAIKIEGRQRSPAYVRQVARVWRQAIDSCLDDPAGFQPRSEWMQQLGAVSEGQQTTLGAYHRTWQ
ncbi:ubiquinone anaerobic biosynthesis protein UbiU [Thiolapillus sp.]